MNSIPSELLVVPAAISGALRDVLWQRPLLNGDLTRLLPADSDDIVFPETKKLHGTTIVNGNEWAVFAITKDNRSEWTDFIRRAVASRGYFANTEGAMDDFQWGAVSIVSNWDDQNPRKIFSWCISPSTSKFLDRMKAMIGGNVALAKPVFDWSVYPRIRNFDSDSKEMWVMVNMLDAQISTPQNVLSQVFISSATASVKAGNRASIRTAYVPADF